MRTLIAPQPSGLTQSHERKRCVVTVRGMAYCGPPASEAVAVADADVVEGFVVAGRVAVGGVIEIDRQPLVIVPAVDELEGNVEQDTRAERLAVGIGGIEVAVVDGSAQAQTEEYAVAQVELPAGVEVGLAGVAASVYGAADGGAQCAAQEGDA